MSSNWKFFSFQLHSLSLQVLQETLLVVSYFEKKKRNDEKIVSIKCVSKEKKSNITTNKSSKEKFCGIFHIENFASILIGSARNYISLFSSHSFSSIFVFFAQCIPLWSKNFIQNLFVKFLVLRRAFNFSSQFLYEPSIKYSNNRKLTHICSL